jgi:hypothetical protein
MRKFLRRPVLHGSGIMALAAALLLSGATPAMADTSAASANALRATLGGGSLLDTGTVTASNDGTQPSPGTVTGNTNPALSVLGTQTLLSVGVLPQQAKANPDGTSAACAGLIGTGGTIQIGPGGDCTPINAPPGGVVLNLGSVPVGLVNGTVGLAADAILAKCTANSDGTTTASVVLVNATLSLSPLGLPVLSVPLPANPTAGTTPNLGLLGLGNLLTLTLNEQSHPNGPASIATTALHLNLLNLIDLRVGNVTCGPNAAVPGVPMIPVKGLPFAAVTLGILGTAVVVVRRRRSAASAPSQVA